MGPGFFVPTGNGELRWLMAQGFHVSWPTTLMALGAYQEPAVAFLPLDKRRRLPLDRNTRTTGCKATQDRHNLQRI
jgi:hypothetical protein